MKSTRRSHPLLASDLWRAYIALVPALALFYPTLIAIVLIEPDPPLADVVTAGYLFFWIEVCVIWVTLTLVCFTPATAEELNGWLRATRAPTTRLKRAIWSLNGGGAIWWALTGGAVSLAALVVLAVRPGRPPVTLLVGGIGVLIASFAMIIVAFAVHYARIDATAGRFDFPGRTAPRFVDYLYLSVQVATTFGGSDVDLSTTRARRAVSFHSLSSWVFNTVLVALLISLLLSAT